ncbi:MAG: hypothetical protein ABI759_30620 [Candidatus Solibacter sp.]
MGREVQAAAKRMRVLRDLVIGVYGPSNRSAITFGRAVETLEHLQQDMASQAAWDLPGFPTNELYLDGVAPSSPASAFPVTPQYGAPSQHGPPIRPPAGMTGYSSAPPLLRAEIKGKPKPGPAAEPGTPNGRGAAADSTDSPERSAEPGGVVLNRRGAALRFAPESAGAPAGEHGTSAESEDVAGREPLPAE